MALAAFLSAFTGGIGGSLLISGLMNDRPAFSLIGGAILAIQAFVLWVWWVAS